MENILRCIKIFSSLFFSGPKKKIERGGGGVWGPPPATWCLNLPIERYSRGEVEGCPGGPRNRDIFFSAKNRRQKLFFHHLGPDPKGPGGSRVLGEGHGSWGEVTPGPNQGGDHRALKPWPGGVMPPLYDQASSNLCETFRNGGT